MKLHRSCYGVVDPRVQRPLPSISLLAIEICVHKTTLKTVGVENIQDNAQGKMPAHQR